MQFSDRPETGDARSAMDGTGRGASQGAREVIRDIMTRQKFGVLATVAGKQPHSSLVAVAPTRDLKRILLATPRSTRKFSNMQKNPRVSLLLHNAGLGNVDFEQACAVTAVGTAREISQKEREEFLTHYLYRHPGLRDFVRSSSCAFIEIDVDVYSLARHFQEVIEWHLKS
jgi:nitroimidazol reductase NimA-like FMN-containing flavoprotein (pyridoxamine 5'-phosphate oxidase superfamily)